MVNLFPLITVTRAHYADIQAKVHHPTTKPERERCYDAGPWEPVAAASPRCPDYRGA